MKDIQVRRAHAGASRRKALRALAGAGAVSALTASGLLSLSACGGGGDEEASDSSSTTATTTSNSASCSVVPEETAGPYPAEDDADIASVLVDYLRRDGFRASHESDGAKALALVRRSAPQLILLDVMLPGLDGMEVLKALRRESSVPVIMITARVEEVDRLLGLELGADDYVCKPFSPREVLARVKTVLRRVQPLASPGQSPALVLDLAYPGSLDTSERAIDSHVRNLRKKFALIDAGHEWLRAVYGVGFALEYPAQSPG